MSKRKEYDQATATAEAQAQAQALKTGGEAQIIFFIFRPTLHTILSITIDTRLGI